jgi:TrmH family RNA methyltransferase
MIESLHSPHVARVKALIGSRGVKERRESGLFVAEGLQAAREALTSKSIPAVKTLYLTASGSHKISELDTYGVEIVEVSDGVMQEMTSTVSPQGIVALCEIPQRPLADLLSIASKASGRIIYLNEIQDPGNAGTILRTADAMGATAIVTSPGSVDFYSPKVVRSTAGSLWHIPVFEGVLLADLENLLPEYHSIVLSSHATQSILDINLANSYICVFGNEARGVDAQSLGTAGVVEVTIPMGGRAESLNLSAAASIVMFTLSRPVSG